MAELTATIRQDIHAAMEKTGGHSRQAALLLGIKKQQFDWWLYNDPELRLKWVGRSKTGRRKSKVLPPPKAVVIHRPPPVDEMAENASAIAKEDALVKQGVEALGIDQARIAMVESWRQLHGRHYKSCLDLVSGGITHQFIDTSFDIKKLTEDIDRIASTGDPLQQNREAMLRQDRQKLLEIQGRMHDQVRKGVIDKATIEYKLNAGKKKKQPGYLAIQAQAGSTVQVKMDGEQNGHENGDASDS